MRRRTFLGGAAASLATASLGRAAGAAKSPTAASATPVLGQGEFRYRQVPGWGVLGDATPVKNCHGIAEDAEGHLVLLTDDVTNNVVIYRPDGTLASKWGTRFPGAHGLSIVREGDREVLYLTDTALHRVFKTTLDGEILNDWGPPPEIPEASYKPSWTLHDPATGEFFVLDGYGTDEIVRYDGAGRHLATFGGADGGITHWGPHGGLFDRGGLLIAMSDQEHLLRVSPTGELGGRVPLPGGNPRQVRRAGDHYFVAHLADDWPADRDSRGFVSVLNADFKVVSNVGGTPPAYDDDGRLRPMSQAGDHFRHPHDASPSPATAASTSPSTPAGTPTR